MHRGYYAVAPEEDEVVYSDFSQETAKKLNELNENRQQTEADIIDNAKKVVFKNNLQHDRIIVASSENWHEGVVGIAASKLAEFFGKPVVLLNVKGETASGSSRSVSGFSIFDAINSARDLLIKFGGHTAAAGLTLKTENIDGIYSYNHPYGCSQLGDDMNMTLKYLSGLIKHPNAASTHTNTAVVKLWTF